MFFSKKAFVVTVNAILTDRIGISFKQQISRLFILILCLHPIEVFLCTEDPLMSQQVVKHLDFSQTHEVDSICTI